MKRKDVMSALLKAAPGLRGVLKRWQREGRCPGDGLADDLAVVARHLAGAGATRADDLPAVVAVAEQCLIQGDHGIRMAFGFGLFLHLWWEVARRPGGSEEVGRRLPPYCRAIWDVCPEVDSRLRAGVERMLAQTEEPWKEG